MKTSACSPWITVALVALLGAGCAEDTTPGTSVGAKAGKAADKAGEAMKETGKDVAKATKEVGNKVADGLSEAADGLATFSKSLASNVSESAEDLGKSIKAKMPDLESLVDKSKAQFNAGGADTKDLSSKLDDKMKTLKTKLDQLAHDGANATKELKNEVVDAFQDVVASVKSGLSKLST